MGLLVLLSTIVYYAAGVRFDASPFPSYMQFIDAELLRDRLLESVWYSHAHPPGLNLLVGVAHKMFDGQAPAFLSLLFHALGFAVALGMFALTLRLTGTRVAAYLCTAVIATSPGFVLYENWLMYTFLEVVLLTTSAVALYKTLDRAGSTKWSAVLFCTLAALVLTRGFFHLGWFVLVVVYVAWAVRNRLYVLRAAAVPLAVATLWYAKNYVYFGAFAGSTMFGLGLSNIGTLTVTRAELAPLVEQGVVSPLALVSRYLQAAELFDGAANPTGIPVLDRPRKSSGQFNFNYKPVVAISEQYASDSFAVVRRYPASYVIGLMISNKLFFSPSSMNEYFSDENRAAVKGFERLFNPLLYGVGSDPKYLTQPHFGFDSPYQLQVNTSVWLIVLSALVIVVGWSRVRRAFVGGAVEDRTALLTLGYLLYVMLYVYALGTMVELGENARYRFVAEPFLAVASAVFATDGVRRLKALWHAHRRFSAPSQGLRARPS